MAEELTRELMLRRNSIERLKLEKPPLEIMAELPELVARGYEAIAEEDIVRLKWYGLYHDKPKIGQFMVRVKIPNGILTPAKLRAIGRISLRFGRNFGELTTRQNIQLHYVELPQLPEIFRALAADGLTTVGACGDTVRNITGCPVTGLDQEELFDTGFVVQAAAQLFYGNPDYSNLPRKHKISIAACAHQCNAPDINCIALVGVVHQGEAGFAARVGGGLSTAPRIARDLGVFIPLADALPVLRAIVDVWNENLKSRVSRVKARLKFMVDDIGPERYRELVEARLGYRLERLQAPPSRTETEHIGIHRQKQEGLHYIGFPVSLGLMTGEQMIGVADLTESCGGDIRLTRQQNFVLTGVSDARLHDVLRAVGALGFPLEANRLRASSIACTGQPLCNFAVASTKGALSRIMDHLEATFGREVEGLRINLDGCPHACAHHWVGDIGLQGTTLRERSDRGEKLEGYDIYLRGGLGPDASVGQPLIRRVPSAEVHLVIERLVGRYLQGRYPGERFKPFCDRFSDAELVAIATKRPLADVIAELEARSTRREKQDA